MRSVVPRTRSELRRHWEDGLGLRPFRQATANENASAFGMRNLSVGSNHLLSQHLVCFGGHVRQRQSQLALRGFFLPAIARSKLRR